MDICLTNAGESRRIKGENALRCVSEEKEFLMKVLVINPGSTSTKIAIYEEETVL